MAGKGIATKSSLDLSTDLLANNIVPILTGFKPKPTELWLICPSRQSITPPLDYLGNI
ncbi:hypothetical protein L3081_14380 [Colwellia sp. MSW7]|uniref:Uncharacterized protein n=1 Tax=Colwellia maritima TaxID=2912588 RepID=A0ABS9X281_9GAMM|nr:hypothetical protein [Colwellia maritima]